MSGNWSDEGATGGTDVRRLCRRTGSVPPWGTGIRARESQGGEAPTQSGFTIIEILIAIVVLSVGLVGVIAVFPTAIQSGARTVEDTYSAILTQSVVDAVRLGLRENRSENLNTGQIHFILQHPGTYDERIHGGPGITDRNSIGDWTFSSVIVLPKGISPQNNKIMIYPAIDATVVGAQRPAPDKILQVRNGHQDAPEKSPDYQNDTYKRFEEVRPGQRVFRHYWIAAAYPASPALLKQRDALAAAGMDNFGRLVYGDPLSQYSWAIALRQATVKDPLADPSAAPVLAEGLYQVTVFVFRNARGGDKPLKEMTTMVSF